MVKLYFEPQKYRFCFNKHTVLVLSIKRGISASVFRSLVFFHFSTNLCYLNPMVRKAPFIGLVGTAGLKLKKASALALRLNFLKGPCL